MRHLPDLSAYLVLDPDLCADLGMIETARAAVTGGVRVVQLRHKTATTAERIALGRALQAALAGTGAALSRSAHCGAPNPGVAGLSISGSFDASASRGSGRI